MESPEEMMANYSRKRTSKLHIRQRCISLTPEQDEAAAILVKQKRLSEVCRRAIMAEVAKKEETGAPRAFDQLQRLVDAAALCLKDCAFEGTIDYQVLEALVEELKHREQALR